MMRDPVVQRLYETLSRVQELASGDFSGVGVLVSDQPESLPTFPISDPNSHRTSGDLISDLIVISSHGSAHHDGFQIVSSDWKLTRVAQYFSPPIIPNAHLDRTKRFGGRYLAALFGSALPTVRLTGIASRGFGVAVFQHGAEVRYEPSE